MTARDQSDPTALDDDTAVAPIQTAGIGQGYELGSYHVLEKLGAGGMGTVYAAEHTTLRRRAAIKVLHDRFTGREEIVERFFNEARAMTAIEDPGIAQVFDFGHEHGTAYIVMELLDGESLEARLNRLGRLPATDVMRLTRQVALSLYAAHQRGVIHRDLKPENIFIVKDSGVAGGERTKILDFGIAKLMLEEESTVRTQTGLMMGTPHYMSPEQCRGAGEIDHRADIYSLGCVVFRLLTGKMVFEATGLGDLVVAHITGTARAPSELVPVPPGIDELVARCLAKQADDRFATMRDLALAIDGMLANTSIEMSRLTPIPTISPFRTQKTRPRWLVPGALTLVAAAAIVGMLATRAASTSPATPVSLPTIAPAGSALRPAAAPPTPSTVAPPPVPPVAAAPPSIPPTATQPETKTPKPTRLHKPSRPASSPSPAPAPATPPLSTPPRPATDPYEDL